MDARAFFDPATFTLTFVVFDPTTRDAVIGGFGAQSPCGPRHRIRSAEQVVAFVKEKGLRAHYVLRRMPTPTASPPPSS